jgi:hypothetical protein
MKATKLCQKTQNDVLPLLETLGRQWKLLEEWL